MTENEVPLLSTKGEFGLTLNRKPKDESEEQIVWQSLADCFAYLFAGNPNAFIVRLDNGGYCTQHREAVMLDWLAHLCGYPDKYMVAVPLRPDGTCYWAALDIDRKEPGDAPIDWGALARKVTELKLPLVVVRSGGGKGSHIFSFFREKETPILASDARKLMRHFAKLLGLTEKLEIFPKQNSLETEKGVGSGISVPYRVGTYETAYGADGHPIEAIDDFLDFCWERCFFGKLLLRDLPSETEVGTTAREDPPLTIEQIRSTYKKHLDTFRAMQSAEDFQNDQLNICSLLAARGFISKAFEESEDALKKELENIARSTPHCKGIDSTIRSGWESGLRAGPYKIAPARVIITEGEIIVHDIPETCLDGWLGEVCAKHMHDFPRAWAWPSLLAAGSVRVPHTGSIRSNLFVALVGAKGFGKSSAVTVANWLMGAYSQIFSDYVGSAEGLAQHLPNDPQSGARLWSVDELGQLLDKSRIEGASYVRVLCTAFYRDAQALIVARGKKHGFNCKLSIIGGIVDDDFEDAFSAVTSHGLYDRFIFAIGPSGYIYDWHPLADYGGSLVEIPAHCSGRNPVEVEHVNGDVWELKTEWLKSHPGMNREAELGLRCALIAAAWDGRTELRAKDLGPALAYAEVQGAVRGMLKPNMGKNQSGELSQKIVDYLKQYAPEGEWIKLRSMLQKTHAFRYGSDLVNRVLNTLSLCGEIETAEDKTSAQHPKIVRWITMEKEW